MQIEVRKLTRKQINSKQIQSVAKFALNHCGMSINLSIVIVSDKIMRQMNRKHLSSDHQTDVIAFNLPKEFKWEQDAEVLVCYDQAVRLARELKLSVLEELYRYIIHGILHVKGYQDNTPSKRKIMWKKQEEILSKSLKAFRRKA